MNERQAETTTAGSAGGPSAMPLIENAEKRGLESGIFIFGSALPERTARP
jgi:hypothetical protein